MLDARRENNVEVEGEIFKMPSEFCLVCHCLYPRDAVLTQVLAMDLYLSVHLSQDGVLPKQLHGPAGC